MKGHEIKAAVFDVDGTLLDTKKFLFRTYRYALRRHGHTVPDEPFIARQIGRSLADSYLALAPNGDIDALCATHREFQDRPDMLKLITVYPLVHEMLRLLGDNGVRRAAWSSRKSSLVASLEHMGISPLVDAVVHGGDVTNHKPHPEGLYKTLSIIEVEPEHAAMIGDAAVDILAGKAAGVALTIGITHGFGTRAELEEAGADYIVDSAAEIPSLLLPNFRVSGR